MYPSEILNYTIKESDTLQRLPSIKNPRVIKAMVIDRFDNFDRRKVLAIANIDGSLVALVSADDQKMVMKFLPKGKNYFECALLCLPSLRIEKPTQNFASMTEVLAECLTPDLHGNFYHLWSNIAEHVSVYLEEMGDAVAVPGGFVADFTGQDEFAKHPEGIWLYENTSGKKHRINQCNSAYNIGSIYAEAMRIHLEVKNDFMFRRSALGITGTLMQAIKSGDFINVEKLLDQASHPHQERLIFAHTAHTILNYPNNPTIQLLIKRTPNPYMRNKNDYSLLHFAAMSNDFMAFSVLQEMGFDPDMANDNVPSPRLIAERHQHQEILDLLRVYDAKKTALSTIDELRPIMNELSQD